MLGFTVYWCVVFNDCEGQKEISLLLYYSEKEVTNYPHLSNCPLLCPYLCMCNLSSIADALIALVAATICYSKNKQTPCEESSCGTTLDHSCLNSITHSPSCINLCTCSTHAITILFTVLRYFLWVRRGKGNCSFPLPSILPAARPI